MVRSRARADAGAHWRPAEQAVCAKDSLTAIQCYKKNCRTELGPENSNLCDGCFGLFCPEHSFNGLCYPCLDSSLGDTTTDGESDLDAGAGRARQGAHPGGRHAPEEGGRGRRGRAGAG